MIPLLGTLLACGSGVDCADPEGVVATAGDRVLTCGEADDVVDYIHVLAGRRPSTVERDRVVRDLDARFRSDPAGVEAWIDALTLAGREIEALRGTAGAERRARLVWEAHTGRGLIRPEHGMAHTVQVAALAVWSSHDAETIALTEADIEAWIRYASLCREVQGAGPLRLSVADRVTVYGMIQERFASGSREDRVALVAFGPYWEQVKEGWHMASYERQQAWIGAAPLPPPMTASSLGYAEALLSGNLVEHAWTLHETLGPFTMVKGRPAF